MSHLIGTEIVVYREDQGWANFTGELVSQDVARPDPKIYLFNANDHFELVTETRTSIHLLSPHNIPNSSTDPLQGESTTTTQEETNQKKQNRAELFLHIEAFWTDHYVYNALAPASDFVTIQGAYLHYCTINPHITKPVFESITGVIGIPKTRSQQYKMFPRDKVPKSTSKSPVPQKTAPRLTDLVLLNTNRLILSDFNKCQFILDTIDRKKNFVICLNETWLQDCKHLTGEIDRFFGEHHITRVDRV